MGVVEMLFRLSRLMASAALLAFGGMSVARAAGEGEEEPVVVRTEEDLARGRENVKNVVDELSALFAADAPMPDLKTQARPILPPYSKIVKGADGYSTLIFRPRFTKVAQIFDALDGIISNNALTEAVGDQNLLLVSAPDDEIRSYQEILTGMDVPTYQILIEAKVVEVVFNDGMQRNLSLGYSGNRGSIGATTEVPGASPQPNTGLGGDWTAVSGSNNFNIAFQWLLTAQDAKVLSSPNILISCNETSRIVTGQDLPIQEANSTGNNLQMSTTFKRVGVTLEVEPSMINEDNVTLRIYPQVSNVIRYESVAAGQGGHLSGAGDLGPKRRNPPADAEQAGGDDGRTLQQQQHAPAAAGADPERHPFYRRTLHRKEPLQGGDPADFLSEDPHHLAGTGGLRPLLRSRPECAAQRETGECG